MVSVLPAIRELLSSLDPAIEDGEPYVGQSPAVKQQIGDMAMNASGIRDTARVLHVSPTTVINELKKRNLNSNR